MGITLRYRFEDDGKFYELRRVSLSSKRRGCCDWGRAFCAFVAFCVAGVFVLGRISATATSIRADLALQHATALGLLVLVDEETGVRGYVATGNPLFLSAYRDGVSNDAIATKHVDSSPSLFEYSNCVFRCARQQILGRPFFQE